MFSDIEDDFVKFAIVGCISLFGFLSIWATWEGTTASLALTNGYNQVQMPGSCGTMWQKDDKADVGSFLFKGGN